MRKTGTVDQGTVGVVFRYGLPAPGKLTVGRELAALTGYKLFHNHLAVDLLLPVFEFGSVPFVELREEFWLSVFDRACRSKLPGLIFTFARERTVHPSFIGEALRTVENAAGKVDFVELTRPTLELRRRIGAPPRREHGKLTSVSLFEQLHAGRVFDAPTMPKPTITIDTGLCTPAQAAAQIVQAPGLRHSPERE